MSNLVIKLNGEIQSSNFDEWKEDLLQQIRSVNTNLTQDSEFALASKSVKSFKAAEKALKKAKASAIEQAADINSLFAAIDAVQAETREVRLTLERQVKKRKAEIKKEFIQATVDKATQIFEAQTDDFKSIGPERFTAFDIFEDAAKGKASRKGLQKAMDTALAGIEAQINQKAGAVKANASAIDSLAAGYKVLFQDRTTLLDLPKDQLDKIIDERIDQYNQEQQRSQTSLADSTPTTGGTSDEITAPTQSVDELPAETSASDKLEKFELVMTLRSSEEQATKFLETFKDSYLKHPDVTDIVLRGV